MAHKGMKLKKIYHPACCFNPYPAYHSSWQDDDGCCANCHKIMSEGWIEKKWIKAPTKRKRKTKI